MLCPLLLMFHPAAWVSRQSLQQYAAHPRAQAATCVLLQVVTLLLHQHRSQEALTHFQQHLASYRHLPSQLAPAPTAAAASHWGWVGRQYQVMGELMSSRVDPAHLPPQVCCTHAHTPSSVLHVLGTLVWIPAHEIAEARNWDWAGPK